MSNKERPSAGLFIVNCNYCNKLFPAENGECECGSNKGELNLDIDKMLNRVYLYKNNRKIDAAIDVIFDVYWQLYDKFDIMNNIYAKIDSSKLDGELLVGFLVQTFKYADRIPNHNLFCDKAELRLKELGYGEKRIYNLISPYRAPGNYWKNIESLGVPECLSGPKPQD